jgi:hypothetical protein
MATAVAADAAKVNARGGFEESELDPEADEAEVR